MTNVVIQKIEKMINYVDYWLEFSRKLKIESIYCEF